jgi:hypothetical protein
MILIFCVNGGLRDELRISFFFDYAMRWLKENNTKLRARMQDCELIQSVVWFSDVMWCVMCDGLLGMDGDGIGCVC